MMSKPPSCQDRFHAVAGCLHGTAVGDAIGLPFEGLSRRRVDRWLRGPLQHRFFFGHGFCSDDTEHTCMVAQALLTARDEPDQKWFLQVFTHNLAWRFRVWLLGLPAGIGLATLRAIVKQWIHILGHSKGVFSAGNGPAMRSAILGVCHGDDPAFLRQLVRASTSLTHTDPRAEHGALAVAWAAYCASRSEAQSPTEFIHSFSELLGDEESALLPALKLAAQSASMGESTLDYATRIGCGNGVSGFVMHTVPVALHAWWSHPTNYAAALETVVRCGGDTDTVGAIVGGIVGARVGPDGIPAPWRARLWEWPRSSRWIDQLAMRLTVASDPHERHGALPLNIPALMVRNILFMVWVLAHGFRRMLPPY
jgi:ADP-ribosyl-[dinitrogen reductase] hydrolase